VTHGTLAKAAIAGSDGDCDPRHISVSPQLSPVVGSG
jgi:hypothetical protein